MGQSDKNENCLDMAYVTCLHYKSKQSGSEPLSK